MSFDGRHVALVTARKRDGESGGAERLYVELCDALLSCGARVERIDVDCDESTIDGLLASYAHCYDLNLDAFDLVISTKAPTFMVRHRNHVSLLVHTVRVFYDRFEAEFPRADARLREECARIRALDLGAFSEQRIRERFAIGAPVVARLVATDPRWRDLPFRLIELPPRRVARGESRPKEHFLIPGRLHRWKRVDLAIQAVRRLPGDTPLLIVGTGEDEGRFRRAAGDDPRVRFLGHVSDSELDELYAAAIAIPFVPVDEDYGFVTAEALAHGRPVVTCSDSGEPARFIQRSGGGLVVPPRPSCLAQALDELRRDPERADFLGERGRTYVSRLSWKNVARQLLSAGGVESPGGTQDDHLLTLAVLDNQPIAPPVGGGRVRLHGLYRELDARTHAIYVGSYDWRGPRRRTVQHGPRLEERTIPHSDEHFEIAESLQRLAGGCTVIDVTQPLLAPLSSAFLAEARRVLERADVAVFSHPWLFPPLADDVQRSGKPIIYDAQNLEVNLRGQLLSGTPFGRALAEHVRFVEGTLCRRADAILVCSEEEAEAFASTYDLPPERLHVTPNGVDTKEVRPPETDEREQARRQLGLSANDVAAIFLGTRYEPNCEAAQWICDVLAPALPELRFFLAGGASEEMRGRRKPKNVVCLGTLDDATRLRLFYAADLALNPLFSGSGTSIKMFEYMAAALAVVASPVGARGIQPGDPPAFWVRPPDSIASALTELAFDREKRLEIGQRARSMVCQKHDWRLLSRRVAAIARSLVRQQATRGAPAALRRRPTVSVVVPSYGRPDSLRRLIERLAEQTLRDFELLVVEQGTKASVLPKVPGFELRHIVTPVRGAVRARNTGLALARAEWVAFVDDDCVPDLDWLESLTRSLGLADVVAVEGRVAPDRPDVNSADYRIVSNEGFEGFGFMTANLAVHRGVTRRIGGFDEIFDHPHFREDTDLGWRLSGLGRIPFEPTARVVHPVVPRSDPRESAMERASFFEKDPILFEKHPQLYVDLFVAEGNYYKIEGFWKAFYRGVAKYDARIDAGMIVGDERVDIDALPGWLRKMADG